eukprot:CAMPEP_0184655746 /NCGR_PEP_ID=MMETSP0308-20130426/14391_1 /TAXON_ID=38269 /ORGANISM="Gloeochaete witrockiana, Strain SAG 46.84" /LENGTH=521 /DNA_ID=CAMNT_0027092469 /DNA_START=198 /DNA_END=1763 /DNA_ORIENTATION=-
MGKGGASFMIEAKDQKIDDLLALKAAIKKEKNVSIYTPAVEKKEEPFPWATGMSTVLGYAILIGTGHLNDFLGRCKNLLNKTIDSEVKAGFSPILNNFESFYTRRLYGRLQGCFNRPISSAAGAYIDVMERDPETGKCTGRTDRCLNLGSYNYLGFAETNEMCKSEVRSAFEKYGAGCASPPVEVGTTELLVEVEKTVARFLNKPAAMVLGMGFASNSTVIPALIGKGGLIISDELNHASIANGSKLSGAKIKIFKHNDAEHLEQVIRDAIAEGQPRTHRPWTKILIVVEGIYSMEGAICDLAPIVAVKKKYKCYLYLDEAHSIGALGATGRGVTEYRGVDRKDVDIMMGTFTKSFGAVGGYIAGSEELIKHIKSTSGGYLYSAGMSPPCCQQILSAFKILTGEDGTNLGKRKLEILRDNSNFFRRELLRMGCSVTGDEDSPVVPMLIYHPGKLSAFSQLCLDYNIAVVVVGFPATTLLKGRVRFCISAAHTKQDLKDALEKLEKIIDLVGLKYSLPDNSM